MRAVNLNDIDARRNSPLRRVDKRLDQRLDLRDSKLLRHRPALVVRDGARADDVVRPAVQTLVRQHLVRGAPDPRRDGAGLAPGVRELDAGLAALAVDEVDDLLERRDLRVGPEPGVLGRDAPAGLDGRSLDNNQPGTGEGELAEVDEVEVRQVAVVGAVGAHGRHDEAVVQLHAARLVGLEERRGRCQVQGRAGGRILRRGEVWRARSGHIGQRLVAVFCDAAHVDDAGRKSASK